MGHESYEGHFLATLRNNISILSNNVASVLPAETIATIPRFYTLYIGPLGPLADGQKLFSPRMHFFIDAANGRVIRALLILKIRIDQ